MLSISHALTGAFLAVTFRHPALYVPATMASHYIEDWIPHWDFGTGLSNGRRRRSHAIIMEIGELGLTAAALFFIFQWQQPAINWLAWIGGGIALIPDFLEAPRNFLKWEPAFLRPLNELHHSFHHSTPNVLFGLFPQMVLWIFIWILR